MKILLMPSDLSGTCEETAFLLSRMAPDCPPGSDFWKAFSRVVQIAFKKDPLADQSGRSALETPRFTSCATYFQVPRHNGFGRMRRELDRLTKRPYKLTYRRPELSRWMLMQLPAFQQGLPKARWSPSLSIRGLPTSQFQGLVKFSYGVYSRSSWAFPQ